MSRPWQPWQDRYARRGGGPADPAPDALENAFRLLTMQEFLEIQEIMSDADKCPRLNAWEQTFLANLKQRLDRFGGQTKMSDKQITTLRRIAADKVYAAG